MDFGRVGSWPRQPCRQRAAATWAGGGTGKIVKQRRLGWANGDAGGGGGLEPHRDGATGKGNGTGARAAVAAPVVRDEYGLPAPAMSSDEDEEEDVVQGVLQRRQEQLAATTAMASTWAPSGSPLVDVQRPPSADALHDDFLQRVGAGGGGDTFAIHVTPLNFEHLVQHGGAVGAGALWEDSLREGALSAPLVHLGSFDDADLRRDGIALQGGRGRGAKTSTKLPKLGGGKGVGKAIGRGDRRPAGPATGSVGGWMDGESSGKSGGVRRKSENPSPYVVEVRRIKGVGGSFKAEMGSGQMAVARRLAREHVKEEEGAGGAKNKGGLSASSPSAFDHLRAVSR